MTAQPLTFTVAGRSLEACWHGAAPDQAPTLVLLHEGLGCVSLWKDFPAALAQRTGCGVLVYSRAGYGHSDPVTLPRLLTYMHDEARDVLPRVLDQANIQTAILVGHSDGASIALIHAATQGDPRIRGAVLTAPHVFTEPMCLDSIREARTAFDDPDTRLREKLGRHHRDVDVAFRGWNDAWLDPGFVAWNLEGFIAGVPCPLLLIQGRDDQYGTAAQLESIEARARVPRRTLWLDNCGHAPHQDCPGETLAGITAFVEELGLAPWPEAPASPGRLTN